MIATTAPEKLYTVEEYLWRTTVVQNLEASITLKSLACELPLSKIYKGVQFETPFAPAGGK